MKDKSNGESFVKAAHFQQRKSLFKGLHWCRSADGMVLVLALQWDAEEGGNAK